MYRQSLTNLAELDMAEVKKILGSIDTILCDCDGVLWLQNNVIQHSNTVINQLRTMGKQVFFVTNNSTKTKEGFLSKALDLGFVAHIDEMLASSTVAAQHLRKLGVKKAYVIGTRGLGDELDQFGIENFGQGPDVMPDNLAVYLESYVPEKNVGAVLVGFDSDISYLKLIKATSYLSNPKCHFIATNTDESFPTSNLILPGTGAIVAAISTASNRKPSVMGKPNPNMVASIMKQYNLNPSRTLMIGDRCNTDIMLGFNCGFQTLLVLSGVSTYDQVKAYKDSKQKETNNSVPDFYLYKLGDLLPLLK